MRCDNSKSWAAILHPTCGGNEATKLVTVHYDKYRDGEHDTLDLCDECAKAIAKDARRHGYKVTTIK